MADAISKPFDVGKTVLIVYQVMLFGEDSYILITGLVGVDLWDEYLPEFKALARSLTRK